MNILYLSHRIPYPPDKGDKIRSFHQVRYLSKSHRIFLACFVDDDADLGHREELRKYCARVEIVRVHAIPAKIRSLVSIFGTSPLSIAYYQSGEMKAAVTSILESERVDLAYIFSSSMAQYVLNRPSLKKIMDFVDVDSDKWRQYAGHVRFPMSWVYKMEADRLEKYESHVADSVDASLFVTAQEMDFFLRKNPGRKAAVIRNGIDLDYFRPSRRTGKGEKSGNQANIVFLGAMDYLPNIDGVLHFTAEILPRVWSAVPEARFTIVGRNPDTKVLRLADTDRRIHVTGAVKDIRPYMEDAAVSVAPLRIARGIQNKVLEAMAMGVPVVASRIAFEGIEATPGKDLVVADGPDDFADGVIAFLKDPSLRNRFSRNARECLERRYLWDSVLGEYEKILCDSTRPGDPSAKVR